MLGTGANGRCIAADLTNAGLDAVFLLSKTYDTRWELVPDPSNLRLDLDLAG